MKHPSIAVPGEGGAVLPGGTQYTEYNVFAACCSSSFFHRKLVILVVNSFPPPGLTLREGGGAANWDG